MLYKIEIYYRGRKSKHKLYETEQAFNRWWNKRKKYVDWIGPGRAGISGSIDGVVVKSYGFVPTDKEVKNEKS